MNDQGRPVLQGVSEVDADQTIRLSDVNLSMGADNSQMNLTWYATQEEAGSVLVAKQSQLVDGAMPENAAKFDATSTPANESGKWSNQATITGLEPGTVYAYQLVNGEEKSDVATFTTATNGAFSFAFAGDPQIGASGNADSDTQGWDKTLGIIADSTQFDGVDFLLSAGVYHCVVYFFVFSAHLYIKSKNRMAKLRNYPENQNWNRAGSRQ
jgi:hypothetical protein